MKEFKVNLCPEKLNRIMQVILPDSVEGDGYLMLFYGSIFLRVDCGLNDVLKIRQKKEIFLDGVSKFYIER